MKGFVRPKTGLPETKREETIPAQMRSGERRWCIICDDWVIPLSDGLGCPCCWSVTMSRAQKRKAES